MRNALRMASLSIVLSTGVLPACAPESDAGARLWRKKCSACHGPDGAGRTRFAEGRPFADLTDGRWKHGSDLASLRRLVADGDPASTMPPFADRLAPEEIDAVVEHALKLAAAGSVGAEP